jgi:hypothetical protein
LRSISTSSNLRDILLRDLSNWPTRTVPPEGGLVGRDELAEMVAREALIGVGRAEVPEHDWHGDPLRGDQLAHQRVERLDELLFR